MSSTNNFHVEDPAIDALDAADILLVYDSSTGKTSRMTAVQSQQGTIVAGSTAATLTSNGITTLSSAANGKALTIAAPVAGVTKRIAFLNSTSTALTITASTDASVTFDGTNCVFTSFGLAPGKYLELIGLSATRYSYAAGSTNFGAFSTS